MIAQIFGSNEDFLTKCFVAIEKKYFLNVEYKMQNTEKNKQELINSKLWILNSEFTFAWIELNMWCPARNVMNTWWGSALLKDKENTLKIIKKLRKLVKMPFSIKTRTGLNEEDIENQMEFLVQASAYVDMITVHGRTVKQAYSWESNRDFIYELKKKCNPKCKIVGNGAIKSYEEIDKVKRNLDGIMIGQAAIGNPRIFTPHTPSREEIKNTILKHLNYTISYENFFQEQKANYTGVLEMPNNLTIEMKNPQAIIISEFRKHLFQYVKWIPLSKEFKQKVATIIDYDQLVEEIQKFFD